MLSLPKKAALVPLTDGARSTCDDRQVDRDPAVRHRSAGSHAPAAIGSAGSRRRRSRSDLRRPSVLRRRSASSITSSWASTSSARKIPRSFARPVLLEAENRRLLVDGHGIFVGVGTSAADPLPNRP
jgi:hypothetical protein